MSPKPFVLITPATRGLSLALTRHYLRTTELPVFATHRAGSTEEVKKHILAPLNDIDEGRLDLLKLDLTSEDSIAGAASRLKELLSGENSYLHRGWFTGGLLHPERQPSDLDATHLAETFRINVISHLLLMKHFSQFLPAPRTLKAADGGAEERLAKWVHVSARVSSISDNRRGGWYSYRSSKAALNQAMKTFDLDLERREHAAIAVGLHPGTVKTDLSKPFWGGVPKEQLFEPEYAAEKLVGVVDSLKVADRGKLWDWAGKEIEW